MKADAFRRNFWLLDGLIGIVFGLWIGYELQLVADSGGFLFKEIFTAALIGAFSYFLAFVIGFSLSKKLQRIPSWVFISVLGSLFFAFNKYIVLYLIENWNSRESDSIIQYILQLLPQQIISFVFITILAAIPLGCMYLGTRLVIYCVEKLKPKIL